jgi:hypothetical protein
MPDCHEILLTGFVPARAIDSSCSADTGVLGLGVHMQVVVFLVVSGSCPPTWGPGT